MIVKCGIGLLLAMVTFAAEDDPKSIVTDAVAKLRQEKGYRAEFSTVTQVPNSDALKMKGYAIVVNPDTLYINYEGSGDQKVEAARKGTKALTRHPILEDEWVEPAEIGAPPFDKGIYDINGFFSTLIKHLQKATLAGDESVGEIKCRKTVLTFDGASLRDIMADQDIDRDAVVWSESSAAATVWVGKEDGRIARFLVEAKLVGNRGDTGGDDISYRAEVAVKEYNRGLELKDVPQSVKKRLGIE